MIQLTFESWEQYLTVSSAAVATVGVAGEELSPLVLLRSSPNFPRKIQEALITGRGVMIKIESGPACSRAQEPLSWRYVGEEHFALKHA